MKPKETKPATSAPKPADKPQPEAKETRKYPKWMYAK